MYIFSFVRYVFSVPSILNNITLPEAKAYLSLQVIDSNESAAVEVRK